MSDQVQIVAVHNAETLGTYVSGDGKMNKLYYSLLIYMYVINYHHCQSEGILDLYNPQKPYTPPPRTCCHVNRVLSCQAAGRSRVEWTDAGKQNLALFLQGGLFHVQRATKAHNHETRLSGSNSNC